jgi:hypothetical protein
MSSVFRLAGPRRQGSFPRLLGWRPHSRHSGSYHFQRIHSDGRLTMGHRNLILAGYDGAAAVRHDAAANALERTKPDPLSNPRSSSD